MFVSRLVVPTSDAFVGRSPSASRAYTAGIIVLALAYGFALASLPLEGFQDRSNYLTYAETAPLILFGYLQDGWLSVLANEPAWLAINAGLSLWLPPETIVRVLIFVSATTVAYTILRLGPQHFLWLLLFLLVPNVIKNYVIHLRQGIAIAVFMLGWQSSSRFWRAAFFAAAPLIHASYFFVLLLLALSRLTREFKFAADLRFLSFLISGLGTALTLGVLAQAVGARQAEVYEFTMDQISGVGFVFWFFILLIFMIDRREFLTRHSFAVGAIVFYLSSYFFVEVSGRIFESAILVVLLAGLDLRGWRRGIFVGAILSFSCASWIVRLSQPALGFGIE